MLKKQEGADQQRFDRQEDRRQKVCYLQPESWKEEVKQYEKDFSTFVAENPGISNHLEKWWESMGIIKINSLIPLNFVVKDIVGYERNQMKFDALQELRVRRKFIVNQENKLVETTYEEQEAEVIF